MRINRIYEDNELIIYKRYRGVETSVPLYFVYDVKKKESTGQEFRTKSQVVSYLKKLNKLV